LLTALFTFTLHHQVALELDSRRSFEQINVLFEADAAWFLEGFVWGSSGGSPFGGRSRVHPNVTNMVNPPLRIAAAGICSIVRCDAEPLRHQLALAVAPAFMAVAAAFVLLTALELGIPLHWSLAFAGLHAASFSNFLFGSIPESYPLSGAGYAALFYLLTRTLTTREIGLAALWVGVGVFLVGVTVTNVVPFAIAATAATYWSRRAWRSALQVSALWTTAAVALTAVLSVALSAVYGELTALTAELGQMREVAPRIAERVIEFPVALTQTVLPPFPTTMDIISVIKEPYSFQFTVHNQFSAWRFALVAAMIAWAAVGQRRQPPHMRGLVGVCAAILAFNWTMHLFFGEQLMLYSQHWQTALLLPFLALMHPAFGQYRTGRWAVAGLAIVAGWNDYRALQSMLGMLTAG